MPFGITKKHGRTHSKAKEQEPEQKAPKRKHKARKHHSTEESAQGEITQANQWLDDFKTFLDTSKNSRKKRIEERTLGTQSHLGEVLGPGKPGLAGMLKLGWPTLWQFQQPKTKIQKGENHSSEVLSSNFVEMFLGMFQL